jgi:glycosyltransferase involved in cell wall biosynthesis
VNAAEMEILSMSICESMACRKPTIAYDVGGNREAVGDPWSLVPFKDFDALHDRVLRLVEDPIFRKAVGERAERHVRKHFDAPVLAHRQAGFYEEILGQSLNGAPR